MSASESTLPSASIFPAAIVVVLLRILVCQANRPGLLASIEEPWLMGLAHATYLLVTEQKICLGLIFCESQAIRSVFLCTLL